MKSVGEAVAGADLICTTTAATAPVLKGEWLQPGTHINAVGSGKPDARELDATAVARSRLFVDRREAALAEAGDVLLAMKEGAIGSEHVLGEISDLVGGMVQGRRSADDITLFKSVGLALEDLAAADYVYRKALAEGRGVSVRIGDLPAPTHP